MYVPIARPLTVSTGATNDDETDQDRQAAVTEFKRKKLALSKKTLADLTPGKSQGRAIRGAA